MTYVLVHGGGFAGSCWDLMVPELDQPSVAVDLPGRGSRPADLATVTIDDFVAAVVEEILRADLYDVTLVGHSMAGLTLPGVAGAIPERLRQLIFVSCAVPPHRTALIEVLGGFSPTVAAVADTVGEAAVGGDGALHPELARAMFCNDMDEDQTAWTLERMGPESLSVLMEPVDLTGLAQPIPRAYVRLTHDASIPLDAQNWMIANLDPVEVTDLEAGHMAMVTRPNELARVLAALSRE